MQNRRNFLRNAICACAAFAGAVAFATAAPVVKNVPPVIIPKPQSMVMGEGRCKNNKSIRVESVKSIPPEGYELSNFTAYLEKKGRRVMGWNEMLSEGIVPKSAIVPPGNRISPWTLT